MAGEFPRDTIGQPPQGGMVGRIKRILLSPKAEWSAIDAEPDTAMGIFTRWAVPLAAIGPIALAIGWQVFGINFLFVHLRPSIGYTLTTAITGYVMSLVSVWVIALVVDALAPTFGTAKNPVQAMKVAAYSMTAGWVGGILGIIPSLAILGALFGIYGFYLFWIGIPIVMKTPTDKVPGHAVATIIAAVVVMVIGYAVVGAVTRPFSPMNAALTDANVDVPGVGSVDLAAANDFKNKVQAASESIKSGEGTKAADPNALAALIPGSLSGWTRAETENSGGGAMGLNTSEASARFTAGDQNFTLKITDTTTMGGLAGIVNVQSSRQTATGYEKTELQDGRMVTEKWDNESKSGEYGILVGKRFMVEAEGSAPSIDILKSAVGAVNMGQLDGMAK